MGWHFESCFIRALQIKGYHFRIFFFCTVCLFICLQHNCWTALKAMEMYLVQVACLMAARKVSSWSVCSAYRSLHCVLFLQPSSLHLLMICKTEASTYQHRLLMGTREVFVVKVWGTEPMTCEDYRCFACLSHINKGCHPGSLSRQISECYPL